VTLPSVVVQWTQPHFDAANDGYNRFETTLSPSNVGGLRVHWSSRGNLDQMSNPLVTKTMVYGAGEPPHAVGDLHGDVGCACPRRHALGSPQC
jgi:hypothetical protein